MFGIERMGLDGREVRDKESLPGRTRFAHLLNSWQRNKRDWAS